MGVMVSEVYDALRAAGAPESKARAAAEAIPATEQLATKQDIADLRETTKRDLADLRGDLAEFRSLLENWRSVVVTHAELNRSQRELKADLNAERWKSTVVQIVATVILVVALLKFL